MRKKRGAPYVRYCSLIAARQTVSEELISLNQIKPGEFTNTWPVLEIKKELNFSFIGVRATRVTGKIFETMCDMAYILCKRTFCKPLPLLDEERKHKSV